MGIIYEIKETKFQPFTVLDTLSVAIVWKNVSFWCCNIYI